MMVSRAQSQSPMVYDLIFGVEPQTELSDDVRSSISPFRSKNLRKVSTINHGVRARYTLLPLSSPRAIVPTHALGMKPRAEIQPRARSITPPWSGRSQRRCGEKEELYLEVHAMKSASPARHHHSLRALSHMPDLKLRTVKTIPTCPSV